MNMCLYIDNIFTAITNCSNAQTTFSTQVKFPNLAATNSTQFIIHFSGKIKKAYFLDRTDKIGIASHSYIEYSKIPEQI